MKPFQHYTVVSHPSIVKPSFLHKAGDHVTRDIALDCSWQVNYHGPLTSLGAVSGASLLLILFHVVLV